ELVGVAGLRDDEDHRSHPSRRLADIGQLRYHGDPITGTNRLGIFPFGAAVERAREWKRDVEEAAAERAAKGGRSDHAAVARAARRGFVVEQRIGVADRLGEAPDRAALDLGHAGLAFGADQLSYFVGDDLVRHGLSLNDLPSCLTTYHSACHKLNGRNRPMAKLSAAQIGKKLKSLPGW